MDTDLLLVIFGLGPTELIIIVAIILLVFGPKHIVRLGSAMGDTVRQVRRASNEDEDDELEPGEQIAEDEPDDSVMHPSSRDTARRGAVEHRRWWRFWRRGDRESQSG